MTSSVLRSRERRTTGGPRGADTPRPRATAARVKRRRRRVVAAAGAARQRQPKRVIRAPSCHSPLIFSKSSAGIAAGRLHPAHGLLGSGRRTALNFGGLGAVEAGIMLARLE